jgi:hypothetical protein
VLLVPKSGSVTNGMARNSSMRGEKIFEFDLDITGVTDYGVSMDAILSGNEKIPPQGACFEVAFNGRSHGRLSGRVRGIDYLLARVHARKDKTRLAAGHGRTPTAPIPR